MEGRKMGVLIDRQGKSFRIHDGCAYCQGQQLAEVSLRLQGKPDQAEKLRPGNTRLSTEVDTLIGQMMDEWLGNAGPTLRYLTAVNGKLAAAVADIKKQINIAQNVVKALVFYQLWPLRKRP